MKKKTTQKLRHLFFLVVLMGVFQSGYSQTTYYVRSGVTVGDWNTSATWATNAAGTTNASNPPTSANPVIIGAGKIVNIPNSYTASAAALTINTGGRVNFINEGVGENPVNGAATTLNCSGVLTVTGTLKMIPAATVSCFTLAKTGTIENQDTMGIFEFKGSTNSTTPWPVNSTFQNVVINLGTVGNFRTSTAGFKVNNNLEVRAGTLNLLSNYTPKGAGIVNGVLSVSGFGILTVGTANTTNSLPNDFTSYNLDLNSTIIYNGASQTILTKSQNGLSIPYYNLTLTNNPNTDAVVKALDNDVTVRGTLAMTNSKAVLAIGSNTLTVRGNFNYGSSTRGLRGSSTSSVIYNRLFDVNTRDTDQQLLMDQTTDGTTNALKNISVIVQGTDNANASDNGNNFELDPNMRLVISNKTNLFGVLTLGRANTTVSGFTETFFGKLFVDNDNGGELIFKSNENTTAILAPVLYPGDFNSPGNPDSFVQGNVVVERYIPSSLKRAYRLLSPSTTGGTIWSNWQESGTSVADAIPGFGTHITGIAGTSAESALGTNDETTGLDVTASGNKSMFTYDNLNDSSSTNTSSWTGVSNTKDGIFTGGTPYLLFVRGDRKVNLATNASGDLNGVATTLISKGTLEVGDVTVTDFIGTPLKWNLVGNPYQAAVNIKTVLDASTSLNNLYYKIYDSKIGSVLARGGYVTVDLSTNAATTTTGTGEFDTNVSGSVANQYLQPNQAFFVQTLGGDSSLTFTEESKTTATNYVQLYRNAAPNPSSVSKIRVSLFDPAALAINGRAYDGSVVSFSDAYSNEIDAEDASKSSGFPDESFGVLNGTTMLDFERRAMPVTNEILPLKNVYNFSASDASDTQVKNYVVRVNMTNMPGVTANLIDTYANTTTAINLDANTDYAYSINRSIAASINATRFHIVFTSTLGIDGNTRALAKVYPNPVKNNEFTIALNENLSNQNAQVALFNLLGQQVYSANVVLDHTASVRITPNTTLPRGVYLLQITSDSKSFTQKIIFE